MPHITKVHLAVILQCEILHKIDLPSPPVSYVFTYSVLFFFITWLLWCGTEIGVFFLLLFVTECVFLLEWTGILHLFIPISKTAIPVYEWKKPLPSSGVYRIPLPPHTAAAAS